MKDKINTSRINFEKIGTQYKKANNIIVENEIIESINCYWIYKKDTEVESRLIIYLHGGCFVLGSINSHQALVSHFADKLDIPILFLEYSLAPENPFPIAINEILKVYHFMLLKNQIKEIIFMGDSAGAGLSVSVISILNKKNIKIPSKLIMLSPWIDLRGTNSSITENAAVDPILSKEQLEKFTLLYLGNTKLSEANPVEAMYGCFPPTLILVGASEILLDDSKMILSKIMEAQPNVKLKVYENKTHVWLLDDIHLEPSKDAFVEITNFINR